MTNLKLTIELLPKGAWGNDFSRTLSKKDWDTIRQNCYKKANHRCQICGAQTDELDAHEVWNFDIENKTQTLVDIIALCSKCHGVKHFRNSDRLGYGQNAKRHFMKVNNCTELEFVSHLAKAQLDFDERNTVYRWKMVADLDKFGGKNIEVKENYIPLIVSPYTDIELESLKNEAGYTPRILNFTIDNYKGIIKISCDKTNKIEWIDDNNNLLETKYNFDGRFNTEFSVKNLYSKSIFFRLIGKYGERISKKFILTD